MVWQENCRIIVMTTKERERSKVGVQGQEISSYSILCCTIGSDLCCTIGSDLCCTIFRASVFQVVLWATGS